MRRDATVAPKFTKGNRAELLDCRREQAAQLLVQDALIDAEIAAAIGVSRRTLARWKREPALIARMAALGEAFSRELRRTMLRELDRKRRSGSRCRR